MYNVTEYYRVPKLFFKYGVHLRGWPDRIPLQPPTSSSLRRGDFYFLFELLLSEELYFEKLPETVLGQVSQHHDMLCHPATFKSHSGRVDLIGRKPVRPVETRSSRLRKRDIKTQPWILDASP